MELKCKHYKGDGYRIPLPKDTLYLCDKCYGALVDEIHDQEDIERCLL